MARFTGSGKLTLAGADARIYDFRFENTGGVELTADRQQIENCYVRTNLVAADNAKLIRIRGNVIWPTSGGDGLTLMGRNHDSVIVGNVITDGVGAG